MDEVDERYENGKIYKLDSNVNDLFYIGSTVQSLARRLQHHERHYRAYQKGTYHYCSSFDVLATGNYEIVLYNDYPCHNKMQLEIEEGYAVENHLQYAGCVNQRIPGMYTRFGGIKQYMKELWKNIEIIQCECGGKYHDCTYNRKIHFKTDKHKYWEEHDEARPKGNNSIQCECGGQYTISNRARHLKRNMHKKYLENQE